MKNRSVLNSELEGQITFEGGGTFEQMKKLSDKMRQYETEKNRLLNSCTSFEEYERKIRELALRIGI